MALSSSSDFIGSEKSVWSKNRLLEDRVLWCIRCFFPYSLLAASFHAATFAPLLAFCSLLPYLFPHSPVLLLAASAATSFPLTHPLWPLRPPPLTSFLAALSCSPFSSSGYDCNSFVELLGNHENGSKYDPPPICYSLDWFVCLQPHLLLFYCILIFFCKPRDSPQVCQTIPCVYMVPLCNFLICIIGSQLDILIIPLYTVNIYNMLSSIYLLFRCN